MREGIDIFDELDVSEIITDDTNEQISDKIVVLPTVDKYKYVFTVWFDNSYALDSMTDSDSREYMEDKLYILKKTGIVKKMSDLVAWRREDKWQRTEDGSVYYNTLFCKLSDYKKGEKTKNSQLTEEIIETNDTKTNKFKISLGFDCQASGTIFLTILNILLEGTSLKYSTRRIFVEISKKDMKPEIFAFSDSFYEHFHSKKGPNITLAFNRFLYVYSRVKEPENISKEEYYRLKKQFRFNKCQNVNQHFKHIFTSFKYEDGFKKLSGRLIKQAIGQIIDDNIINKAKKNKNGCDRIDIVQTAPWDTRFFKETSIQSFELKEPLEVLDVRFNHELSKKFVCIIYCGVSHLDNELKETFIVLSSKNVVEMRSDLDIFFPKMDTYALNII